MRNLFTPICFHVFYFQASRFSAVQHNFVDSVEEVKAMDSLRGLVKNVEISPEARVYGLSYLWAESYKV